MTVITESLSSMRIIPEVLWMYHSFSACLIKPRLTDIRTQDLFSTAVISAVKISNKMHHITTYIGIEGNGFVCVGNANDLDAPGAIFSYQSYVREQEAMLPFLIDIFETNTGVK